MHQTSNVLFKESMVDFFLSFFLNYPYQIWAIVFFSNWQPNYLSVISETPWIDHSTHLVMGGMQ